MTEKTVSLTVNGRPVTATVEPRQHLADFLREHLLLTGTHLGCEHGVCGACTLMIDGEIARSCITFAVALDGAEIRTIEGFDDDTVMERLRRTFTEEHGLQCGYCTPGMLIAARDIVIRLPGADERRIRLELSGNLCRCTGYTGIVRAVQRVLEERRAAGEAAPARATAPEPAAEPAAAIADATAPAAPRLAAVPEAGAARRERGLTTLTQSFVVHHPRDAVWRYLRDVEKVASCMPGAALTEPVADGRITGRIAIKLGPIGATFAGKGEMALDETNFHGVIEGAGRDSRSATRAKGRVEYRLLEHDAGAATRVEVEVAFSLAGPLAQFSRGGIVNDLAGRLTAAFADNLQARLDGLVGAPPTAGPGAQPAARELDAGGLLISVIWTRIKAALAAIFGRS